MTSNREQRAVVIPKVELFGRSFLSVANLRVGWSLTWRVAIIDAAVSMLLRGSLLLLRGGLALDVLDQLLLFAATTITGLLATDWAGRRVARIRYGLRIDHFIGWAIAWRQSLASTLGVVATGFLLAGGLALAQLSGSEGLQRMITLVWVVMMLLCMIMVAVGSAGWATHRVFATQAGGVEEAAPPRVADVGSETLQRSGETHASPEPDVPPRIG
jgi:hypothetical protein